MNPQFMYILSGEYRYQPIIDMNLETLVGMFPNLFNFILIAVILTYLLYKPVKKILQARADRVESDIKDAALSKMSAAELKAEYEKRIKEIETERASILEEARKSAAEKRELIIENAKTEAADVKARAEREIVTEKEQIKGAVHHAIIEISTDMAEKIISAKVDQAAHEKLFADALAELEATTFAV